MRSMFHKLRILRGESAAIIIVNGENETGVATETMVDGV